MPAASPWPAFPTGKHEYIKMVLDCGAMGIVAPMVMDAAEARSIVAATKYPPRGNRSVGGGMHALNFGATAEEYYSKADDEILVIIQTEHIKAVEIADEIYSVPGVDAVFVGPNDLAYSMRGRRWNAPEQGGLRGDPDPHPRGGAAQQAAVRPARVLGRRRPQARREGWQFIAVGSELKMMLDGAAERRAANQSPRCPGRARQVLRSGRSCRIPSRGPGPVQNLSGPACPRPERESARDPAR